MEKQDVIVQNTETVETKLLGAHVPERVYWAFKKAAATRKESMAEAIEHAALIYISMKGEE